MHIRTRPYFRVSQSHKSSQHGPSPQRQSCRAEGRARELCIAAFTSCTCWLLQGRPAGCSIQSHRLGSTGRSSSSSGRAPATSNERSLESACSSKADEASTRLHQRRLALMHVTFKRVGRASGCVPVRTLQKSTCEATRAKREAQTGVTDALCAVGTSLQETVWYLTHPCVSRACCP